LLLGLDEPTAEFALGRFRLFLLRYVGTVADEADKDSILGRARKNVFEDPAVLAVVPAQPVLMGAGGRLRKRILFSVVGMN